MKSIAKLSALILAAATCLTLPAQGQTNTTPATTNAAPRRPRAAGFRGTIASVDAATMTLTLKGRNSETKVKITSETKIKKDRQPAVFADAVEGLRVSGSGKKDDEGVWTANTLNITTKPAAPPAAAKPAAPATPQ